MTKEKQLGIRSKNESCEASITEFPYEEFDSNGNLIYKEYLDGFWYKQEFDSNSNLIYSENSSGYWYKQEFDSNNNIIYLEDSDGYGFFSYYEGDRFIKEIREGGYKEHYLAYKRNLKLNKLLND